MWWQPELLLQQCCFRCLPSALGDYDATQQSTRQERGHGRGRGIGRCRRPDLGGHVLNCSACKSGDRKRRAPQRCAHARYPVSGGEPKAVDGTLAIMVGGDKELFEQVKDILLIVGRARCTVDRLGLVTQPSLPIR